MQKSKPNLWKSTTTKGRSRFNSLANSILLKPRKFVTLKWIKKGEVKTYAFYASLIHHFREFGIVHQEVYGQDSLGRGHVHFIYTPLKYFSYKEFVPKFCHINYVNENASHIWYIHKHHRIPIDDLYPVALIKPNPISKYLKEQLEAIKWYQTHYGFDD